MPGINQAVTDTMVYTAFSCSNMVPGDVCQRSMSMRFTNNFRLMKPLSLLLCERDKSLIRASVSDLNYVQVVLDRMEMTS